MANGIEGNRGLYGTFSQWLQEAKISEREYDRNGDGKIEGKEIVAYVLSHFDKFSPKIQKQIEVLQKAFRALGFGDEEARGILTGEPKAGAKKLAEKGLDFEKRAQHAKTEGKKKEAAELLGHAEQAYRLAVDLEPKDSRAHFYLADLLYRRGETEAGRRHAGQAVQNASFQEIPDLILWLQTVKDPQIKSSLAINFVAAQLVNADRHNDARKLYAGAARALVKDGDEVKAQKYREKALLVDEMGKAYRPDFDAKSNPEVLRLYEALRAEGIPTGLMAGADPNQADNPRSLSAAQVLGYVDKHGDDPRVRRALESCDLRVPKMKFKDEAEREAFEKLGLSQRLSFYHQKKAESVKGDKAKAEHLAAAAHFDPANAAKSAALAEFHLERKQIPQAVLAYENAHRAAPQDVALRQKLADAYLAADRWEKAYPLLPGDKAETLLAGKLEEARQYHEAGETAKAKEIVRLAWGLIESDYKKRAELPATEAGRILRLKTVLDLTAGDIHHREKGDGHGVQGYRQAVEASTEALVKNPADRQALLLRAKAHEKVGDDAAAMADYQAAAKLSPDGVQSLPEEYIRFTERYRERLRGEFRKELDNFKRFTHETDPDARKEAEASMAKLEEMAWVLRSFPTLSDYEKFQDLKLVREFYKAGVQKYEALAVHVFEGQGAGTYKTLDEKVAALEAIQNREREHKEYLKTEAYLAPKANFNQWLGDTEDQMRELRNKLLPSLELKPGEAASLDQVAAAEVAALVNRELGHYNGLANSLDQWKALVDALPPHVLDTEFRLEQYSQMIEAWKEIRRIDASAYPLGLPDHSAVNERILGLFYGENSVNALVESYAKSRGLPWDAEAYNQLTNGILIGDETQDTRLMKFLTPSGIEDFFTKNNQAKALERQGIIAYNSEDPATGLELSLQSLHLYGQLGNAPKVAETIEYIDSQTKYSQMASEKDDIHRDIEALEVYQRMGAALQGSGLLVEVGKSRDTFEDRVLEEARSLARRLSNTSFVNTSEEVEGLVAARAFFAQDRDSESVEEVDKKLKEGQERLEAEVMSRVPLLEGEGEREMRAYGSEFSMYPVEERKALLEHAAGLVEADLALLGNQDLSKKDVREKAGRQLLQHADLWRRALEANSDLPADFRLEQYRKLAATVALFQQFTQGDMAPFKKEEGAKPAYGDPPTLEVQTEAVAKLGKALLEEHSHAFYLDLPEHHYYVVETARKHGLSSRLEDGIVGYYLRRADNPELPPITEKDWQEIEKIQMAYKGDAALEEILIQRYLFEAGKFDPVSEERKLVRKQVQEDYQARIDQAFKEGDAEFLATLGPVSIKAFGERTQPAYQKLAESRNPDLPLEGRLQAAMEAAAAFGELGLKGRMEEALTPVKAHIDALEDPGMRATGYYSLAQLYEMSGMDEAAKGYLQKIVDLDPGEKAGGKAERARHEMAVFARGKQALIDGDLDAAKGHFATIEHNALAQQYLGQIDGIQFQQRVGYPLEFLSGVLMAEVDKRAGNRDDIEYQLNKRQEVDAFRKEAQEFLTEARRLCQSGECQSLQEAIERLKQAGGYYDVFHFLESTGRGKDTLAYVKTMGNPHLSDVQMAGETLHLAEKLLDRDDFGFSMQVAAGLLDDPFVSKQAKDLVKDRIPDAAKWHARKQAIWKAVKDILIVPAIVEGRYGDAFVSALTTVASFGVGRIFSAGAKIAWAGFTARSVARAGWMARFAAYAPRGFRVAEVGFVAMADNAGFAVGSMLTESAVTGKNQFSWDRLWHELLVGIAPFGLVHGTGKVMQGIGKRAEHIPWMKVAGEAEAALLKSQGQFAVKSGWRAGLWTTHRLLNASAFTVGGLVNQQVGLIEKDGAPLGMVFLQNLAMDLQMTAAHKSMNFLTGGKLEHLDRKLDRELYLAPTLARLKIGPRTAQGKAMSDFLYHYADARAAQLGKPLSGADLAKEVSALNKPIEDILQAGGLNKGPAYEAARLNLMALAAKRREAPEWLEVYAKEAKGSADLKRAVEAIAGKEGLDVQGREALQGTLLLWALGSSERPTEFRNRLAELGELSPKIGKDLETSVRALLGDGAMARPEGKRLAELLLLRALEAADSPQQVRVLIGDFAKQAPHLQDRIGTLAAANGLAGPEARLATLNWVLEKGFTVNSLDHLLGEVRRGEAKLVFEEGKIRAEAVPVDQRTAWKDQVAASEAGHHKRQREAELASVVDSLGLLQTFWGKSDKDRYQAMLADALAKGKVAPEQAKELFLGLKPSLAKHVEPMQLEAVSNAVFLKILSGELSADQVWDLSARLAKGEIILEVGSFGEYREALPYAHQLPKDHPQVLRPLPKAPDDLPTVTKPMPKDTPPPAGGGDGTQVGSGRGRRKPAADDGQDQAAAYAGDTRVDDKAASRVAEEPLAWKPTGDGGQEAKLGGGVLKTDKQGSLTLEFPDAKDPVSLKHNGREFRLESDDILQIRAGDTLEIDGVRYVRSGSELRPFTPPTPGKVLADGGNGKIFDNGDGSVTKQGKTRQVMTADGTVREIDPATAFDNEQRALAFVQDMAAREPALSDFAPALIGRTGAGELVIGKVPGKTLENLGVAERKAIPEQAWKDFETALQILGEAGLYHGDMNPQNVLWDGKKLRLIDFGNAQFKVADNNDMKRFQEMKADARSDRADFPIRAHAVAKGNQAIPDPAFKPSEPAPTREAEVIPLRPVDGDGTKVVGKGRKGQKPPPPAETGDGYFEAAAFSGDPRGPIQSDPGLPQGSKGEEKTRKADEGPRVGLLLSADGLDGFSVRTDQEKTLRWSSRDGKIPGEPWAVDIKPLGDGTFLLIPVEGTIRYHDGASYVEVPKKGLALKSDRDLRLQLGDLDFQWRKPGAETGKSLVTGSRQAGEFLVGEIFDYYHGADTQKTLLVFTKRQDAWGEAARAFEKDLGQLEGLYKEYHGLVETYRKDPTLEGRKDLNRKWEAIEGLSKQLHTSRYHRMETQHAWTMRAREAELFPLETFLGMAEFHALEAARNHPDGKSDFSYEVRYAKPEELAGFEGAWSQVPFDKFVGVEASVKDWETAQKLVGEMKQNGDLHVISDFSLSPDGKTGRAVVEIWGEKPRRVEIRFSLRDVAAAEPKVPLPPYEGRDISDLKPGDLLVRDAAGARPLEFSKKYNQTIRLPQGDLLLKWDPATETHSAIWFGKEPLRIHGPHGEVRTLGPSRHGRKAKTETLRGDETLVAGDREVRLVTLKVASEDALQRAQIQDEVRTLEALRLSIEEMKARREDPAKIADYEKMLVEAEAVFAKSLRQRHRTAEGIPYAEATNAQIGTANLPEGPGVAGFKSITDIEAKADKIAKAAPDAERIARYVEHLVHKKGMSRPDAEVQAQRWAEQVIVDARAHQAGRTHIYDTSLPLKPETAHMDKATVDHHGRFANPLNSTEQLLGKMEATLETVKGNTEALDAASKDGAAMAAARRGFAEAGVRKPKEAQVVEVAAAIRELNLKEVTTDNLADGGWSVWVARNQARILADPALRKTIAEATRFEDFSAFGTVYIEEAKTKKVAELVAGGMPEPKAKALADEMVRTGEIFPEGIRWQAALFQKYGEILKKNGIVGSDRFLPAQAERVMGEALAAIDQIVYDSAARDAATAEFFGKVEEGAKAAAEKALIAEASVHQGDTNISFFDLTKLGDFTVFQQWLALPRVSPSGRPDGIQVSVVPMKPLEAAVDGQTILADRKLQIVAIPNGRELPSQKGLLSALNAMNQAEVAKAEALGLTPKAGEPLKPGQLPRDHFEKLWFGKDNVILPNPMKGGSLLTPKEVSAILTDGVPGAKPLGLFESTDLSRQIDKLPPKSKHLVELMSAPYDVDGILVQPDVKPIVDLIRELGPDKVEAVLARGETSSENLSRLLDRATNENFPGQAAAVRAYLNRASAEEILFLTDTKAMFVDRLANLKLEADGKSVSVWELLTTENPYPYLEAVQQIAFPGVRDHVLAAMALREFYHPTRTEVGAEFLAMFGIDPATHEHFPWTPKDNLERAALYVTVAKEKRNLLSAYQRAFPNVAKADLDAFVNDLWKTLRTQDVQDTHLPYTPHGWNHSLTVMHDSARIFDEAGPVREAIVAKLRPKYGDRAELVARELVKFIGIFHDTGYGCLHPHEHKGLHAERSGDLFKQGFAVHMEKVFGIKSDDPLFNEIFLAIERHGADKPGKAEYMRASEKENPFLFVIRMADNLDLTNRRMRQVQLNQPVMAALKEMYLKGQDPNFQALEKPERKREIEKIQAKHARAFDQAVKEGRMSRGEADRNKKLLEQLNESTYPHFAGTEQVTGYRLIQDPASGQLTVEIELAGYARGQAIAESGLLVDHPLYQVLRTYIAAQSMTYGIGPDGRGLPIKFTYRETFRATTTDGHELPLQPDNVRDFEPKPQRPDDTNPPAAPAGAQAVAVPEPQRNYFGYAVSADFEIGLRNLVTADAGDPLFSARSAFDGLVLGIRNLYRAAVGMEVPGFVSGKEEAGFPHNVHRHYFFSEDRGPVGKAGIYDKRVDVEAMQKRTVVEWDRIAVSYDSEGRTVFLYQKSFDSEIGVDSAGNRTKANTVVVSADGKIVTGFPAAEGGKDWVTRGELDAVGGDLAKLAAAKFRAGDAETRYAASLPDHPLVYRDAEGLRVAVYGDDVPVALVNRRTRANYLEKSAYEANENEAPIVQSEIPVTVKGKKNLRQVVTGKVVEMYFEQPIGYREVRKPDGSVERLPLHWNRAILNDKGELIGGYPIAERGESVTLPEKAWNPLLREENGSDAGSFQWGKPKLLRQLDEQGVKTGVYEVEVVRDGKKRKAEVRLDTSLTQQIFKSPEANLANAFSKVSLARDYELPNGDRLRFTGDIAGQGSTATVFLADRIAPDGSKTRVTVKVRTHGMLPAEQMNPQVEREAKTARALAEIDPRYGEAGLLDLGDGRQAFIAPYFSPDTSVFFTTYSVLPEAVQKKVRPQLEEIFQKLAARGIGLGDVEFVMDREGKVTFVDLEGVRIDAFDPRDAAAHAKALRYMYEVASLPESGGAPLRAADDEMLAAAVGGRGPVGGLSDGSPHARPESASSLAAHDSRSWSGVTTALASQEIPLRDIPAGVTELPIYLGSPDGVTGHLGPALVVQDGVQRGDARLWGMLKREGEDWVYYPTDPGAETVKDVGYAVKALRPDGFVGLGEGDRLSLGFADFQYRDGRLVLSDDLGTLNVALSLRLPEGVPGRGGVDPKDSGGWGGGPTAADLQPPPKPEKPSRELTEFSEKMNRRRAALLEKLAGLGEVQGSAKKFSAAEIEELAWLVAERGMDPQKLPRQAREALDEYMVAFVAEYGRLYPAELERKVNPFTGEALQRPNPKRPGALIPAYDAQYRYLRSLANRDLGKPLFGEPSPREREALVNFVSRGMGLKVADYAEAQKVLREEILARTPRAEQALRAADPNLKYYALLSLRGDQAYLALEDGPQGLNLVRFLGKIGFDQEVGVTVVMNGDVPEYRFLIGGWDHVLLQKPGERFLIHSHTKYFLNPKSQVMNKGEVTMASEAGKEHRISAAVLFSMTDLAGMAGEALQAAREGKAVPLLYDPATRVFRNYVQHPYGMSAAEVHVDASGKVDGIIIRYAFDDKAGLNHDRLPGHKQELTDFLKKYLPDAKVQIQEVSMSELERGLPSP